MLTESQKFKLGIFVIAAAVLLVAFILIFAGGKLFEEKYHVHTVFTESVQGLEAGAAVKFRGVPIGQVTSIKIEQGVAAGAQASGEEEMKIVVSMDISPEIETSGALTRDQLWHVLSNQIQRGARCQLAFAGITGMKFIQIDYYAKEDAAPPTDPLDEGKRPEDSFFIPAQPSLLAGVTVDLTETLAKIANIPFDKIGRDTDTLVADVSRLASGIDALVRDKRVDSMLTSLDEAVKNMAKVTARVDREADQMRQRLEKGVNQFNAALAEVEGLVKDTRATLKQAKLGETLAAARDGLRSAEEALKGFGHMRADLQPVIDKLDETINSINGLAKSLEDDPSALVRGKRKPRSQIWSEK